MVSERIYPICFSCVKITKPSIKSEKNSRIVFFKVPSQIRADNNHNQILKYEENIERSFVHNRYGDHGSINNTNEKK